MVSFNECLKVLEYNIIKKNIKLKIVGDINLKELD